MNCSPSSGLRDDFRFVLERVTVPPTFGVVCEHGEVTGATVLRTRQQLKALIIFLTFWPTGSLET